MKQIEGVEKVKIIIEGKEGKLPEGTDISRGIPILNKINEV
jgi:germination protein M